MVSERQSVEGTSLRLGAPSAWTEAMSRLFGDPPWVLRTSDTE